MTDIFQMPKNKHVPIRFLETESLPVLKITDHENVPCILGPVSNLPRIFRDLNTGRTIVLSKAVARKVQELAKIKQEENDL